MKSHSRNTSIFVLIITLFISGLATAQTESKSIRPSPTDSTYTLETVIVTATRTETPVNEVASSVTVVTAQDIERKQKNTVLEALRGSPGLDVVQTGGLGRTTSIFLRGANSDQTLVLIDGVEMNDPISAGRAYNFANLTTNNVARIEVLRGPQSTLYGSDAMGGVINIITRRGRGRPRLSLSAQGGSFGTFIGETNLSGGTAKAHYTLGTSWLNTQGFSAADDALGNSEKDGYRNASFSGKVGLTPRQDASFDLMFRIFDATADLDNGGGVGQDDPNNKQDTRQIFIRPQVHLKLWNQRWQNTFGYAFSDHDRDNLNPIDADHPQNSSESSFNGRIHRFDWQSTLHLHEFTTLIFGTETEEEQGNSLFRSMSSFGPFESPFVKQSARITGYYLQDQVHYRDMFFAALGIRVDDHSLFGAQTTYRVAPSFLINQTSTRLKGSVGTGFKAPSLFQLYSSFGDPNLQPGESTGWDVGIEQSNPQKTLTTGLTYFYNDFTNLIDFDSATSTYNNITKVHSRGIEWFGRAEPHRNVQVQVNYTFTDAEDKTTDMPLVRRPRHKVGFDTNFAVTPKANVHVSANLVGERVNQDFSSFPSTRVTLDSYQIVNVATSYRVMPFAQVFGRIDNLLDQSYQEVLGYGTPGISAYLGIRLNR